MNAPIPKVTYQDQEKELKTMHSLVRIDVCILMVQNSAYCLIHYGYPRQYSSSKPWAFRIFGYEIVKQISVQCFPTSFYYSFARGEKFVNNVKLQFTSLMK